VTIRERLLDEGAVSVIAAAGADFGR